MSKKGDYYKTHALLDDGTEAEGYGKDFQKGDQVMVFYHKQQIKMAKKDTDED